MSTTKVLNNNFRFYFVGTCIIIKIIKNFTDFFHNFQLISHSFNQL